MRITPLFALVLSGAAAALCYRAAGPTLGLFLGPFALVTLLTPLLVLAEPTWPRQLATAGGIVAGTVMVWAWAARQPNLGAADAVLCGFVLAAYVLALCGAALALRAAPIEATLAAFLVTLIGLAWLTWPVWLSPWLGGHDCLVRWLSLPHPLLAANGAVKDQLGLWGEQHYAYRLTILNRDVALAPSGSLLPATALHGMIGALGILAMLAAKRRRRWLTTEAQRAPWHNGSP